tara:strand:- start:139 stop:756 length:618 start_codon:yes stop_codon:yes gene_type:complete
MIKVELNIETLEDLLKPIMRQVPFVVSKAINDTLFGARKNQMMTMNKTLDGGPTRWTKSSLLYEKATRSNLSGELYFSERAPYMRTVVHGGTITPAKKKLVAPVRGKVKLTKQGNLTKNKIQQLKAKRNHFVGLPGGSKDQSKYGVYKKKGRGKNQKLERIVYINLSSRKQKATYDGPKFAKRYIENHLHVNLVRAAIKAVDTSR